MSDPVPPPCSSPDLPQAVQLLAAMWIFMQSVTTEGEPLLREQHGLDLREVIALSYVRSLTPGPTELARALHLPRYEVSRLLSRLEGRGLLQRRGGHAPDARRVRIHLTPAGEHLWQASLHTANEVTRRHLRHLTDPQLDHLTLTLADINARPSGEKT